MKPPKFTYPDVQYSTNNAIANRALDLFLSGKVGNITEGPSDYSATVQGSKSYHVNLSVNRIYDADCTCYMGQNGDLCKHVLAVAYAVLKQSGVIKEQSSQGPLNLKEAKPAVNAGMRRIKPYRGPSRIWFGYQRDLSIGSGIVEDALRDLPPTEEHAKYLWSVVKRLDQKLLNGVDDSDGTVGGCTMTLVERLAGYAKTNPELLPVIERFCADRMHFDFHTSLESMIDELRAT